MKRFFIIAIVMSLAACGIDGDPLAPDGALDPVRERGSSLTNDEGAI